MGKYTVGIACHSYQIGPSLFQEMMERFIAEMKENPTVAKLLEKGEGQKECFVGAFFDDVGIGSSNVKDHLFLLEQFFKVVEKHQLRIKLSKCDFLQETFEYLGFTISWVT